MVTAGLFSVSLCGVSPGEVGGAMSGQSCLAERRWGGGRGGSVGGVLAVAETFSTTETQRLLKRNHGDPRQSCVLSNRTIVNKSEKISLVHWHKNTNRLLGKGEMKLNQREKVLVFFTFTWLSQQAQGSFFLVRLHYIHACVYTLYLIN